MSSAGCEGGEIGSEGAVELAGDEAFEAADGFFLGLAFCDAALHVAAGSVAVAEPDEDDEPPWDSWRVWCALRFARSGCLVSGGGGVADLVFDGREHAE